MFDKMLPSEILPEEGYITNRDSWMKPRRNPRQYGTLIKLSLRMIPYNHHKPVLTKFPAMIGKGRVDVDLVRMTCTKLTNGDP